MMYNNKFVACVKSAGKILREFGDTVYIPYGSEYSILVKNLNSVRALVNISIDGTDVCSSSFVVGANSELNIERFIKDNNLTTGNRFKFIERTAGVEDHRGTKVDDGIIRISVKYERVYQNTLLGGGITNAMGQPWTNTVLRGTTGYYEKSLFATSIGVAQNVVCSTQSVSDIGITVPGSISDQKFTTTSVFPTETEEHVLILRLLGETETAPVIAPVTVKSKPKCVTCGKLNKATSSFCSSCGTALTIV